MPLVSVIVPVYRAELYLERCIYSVLEQSYSNIELILVDDGSPDGCGAICDKCAEQDTRVLVIHKNNEGVSAARNTGIDAASGEHIVFVDSDDYVDKDFVKNMISHCDDLVVCGSTIAPHNGEKQPYIVPNDMTGEVTPILIAEWFDSNYLKYVWGKLFNRKLIEKGNLRFDTNISLGEDVIFVVQYILLCKQVTAISDCLYNYIKYATGSLTKQLTHHMVISNNRRDRVLLEEFRKNGIDSKVFATENYISKQKMKWAFFSVFEDNTLNIRKKYKWYRLFFSLELFVENIDIITKDCSQITRKIIQKKSAALMMVFHLMVWVRDKLHLGEN